MMSGFVLVTLKLLIGFFALTIIINLSGKGDLAPLSASEQVQN
jgi:predicted membrane protein